MSSVELQSPPSGWLVWYGRLLEGVVMALMVILFLEVMIGVVFRMAGHSLSWYDEVASILLAWLTFYGSALASLRRSHIGCPEIVEQLSPGWRRLVGIFSQCLGYCFLCHLGMGWVCHHADFGWRRHDELARSPHEPHAINGSYFGHAHFGHRALLSVAAGLRR